MCSLRVVSVSKSALYLEERPKKQSPRKIRALHGVCEHSVEASDRNRNGSHQTYCIVSVLVRKSTFY